MSKSNGSVISSKLITKLKVGMMTLQFAVMTTAFIAPQSHAADLLYEMDFEADTVLSIPYLAYDTAGWQEISGIDPNGNAGPISLWGATDSGFDMIADATVTASTLSNYMTNQIQQVAGPDGTMVSALFQNVKKSNAGPPTFGTSQNSFMIRRGSVDSGDKTDTGDVYYTYWFKFQSDLHKQLGTSGDDNWRVMSEWKTGGLNNTWKGDYRIITTVVQDASGHLYWHTRGDNKANGIPEKKEFWSVTNSSVPVPVGEWFKYEVFWHRSGGNDGRYWAAVNGQIIVDHYGPNMGAHNLPINRIMLTNNYSGGKTPCQQWITGLQIWNGFPCGVGVSCYDKSNMSSSPAPSSGSDITAPSAPSGLNVAATSSTSFQLTWNESRDNVDIASYWIYRNGINIGKSTVPYYTDTTAVRGATYKYNLNAHDSAGNVSTPSNLVTVVLR